MLDANLPASDIWEVIKPKDKIIDLEKQFLLDNYNRYIKEMTGVSAGDGISARDLYEYSKLSAEIYKEGFAETATNMGYKVIAETTVKYQLTGLKAAILMKNGFNILIIEGANLEPSKFVKSTGQLIADTQIALQKNPKWQLGALKEFVGNYQSKYELDKIDIVAGHSLGGTLATLWGVGQGVSVIAYDPLGTKELAYRMYGQAQTDDADITTIVGGDNIVNSQYTQLGNIITLPASTKHCHPIDSVNSTTGILEATSSLLKLLVPNITKEQADSLALQPALLESFKQRLSCYHSIENISETLIQTLNYGEELSTISKFGGDLSKVLLDFTNYDKHAEWWRTSAAVIQQQVPEFKDMQLEQIQSIIQYNLNKLEKNFNMK